MNKESTFIRLEPTLKQALVRFAEMDGRSMSSLIGKIVADWVKAQPPAKGSESRR
jgi:predicted transcriptional regulator